jgi:hypothetical protein
MFKNRLGKSAVCIAIVAGLSLALSSGCGKSGVNRVRVWGNVTWKGQPVPRGVVYFSPDTTKGNKGPQGFALIKDGHYDSRDPLSKGCVTGPQVAIVHGCDGQGIGPGSPYGHNLFAPYQMPLDVSAEGGQVDLTIPDSAPAAAAASSRDGE